MDKEKIIAKIKNNYKDYTPKDKAYFSSGYLASQKLSKNYDKTLYSIMQDFEADAPMPVINITMFNSMMEQFNDIIEVKKLVNQLTTDIKPILTDIKNDVSELNQQLVTKKSVYLTAKEERKVKSNALLAKL